MLTRTSFQANRNNVAESPSSIRLRSMWENICSSIYIDPWRVVTIDNMQLRLAICYIVTRSFSVLVLISFWVAVSHTLITCYRCVPDVRSTDRLIAYAVPSVVLWFHHYTYCEIFPSFCWTRYRSSILVYSPMPFLCELLEIQRGGPDRMATRCNST